MHCELIVYATFIIFKNKKAKAIEIDLQWASYKDYKKVKLWNSFSLQTKTESPQLGGPNKS